MAKSSIDNIKVNGLCDGEDRKETDPELEAEKEFAKDNGLTELAPAGSKFQLKKSQSMDCDQPVPRPTVNGVVTVDRNQKNLRRSRSGRGRGQPKKCGGGGKGTWGRPGKLYEDTELEDPDDPNYDSETQGSYRLSKVNPEEMNNELKKQLTETFKEYFENGDTSEVLDALSDLADSRSARSASIRQLISLALDQKHTSARELASVLLSDVVKFGVFGPPDVQFGFDALLNADLADLTLDCPLAPETLGKFMARGIADMALPHSIIDPAKASNAQAGAAMEHAELLLKHRHKLDTVWGLKGGSRPVRDLEHKIKLLLEEYLDSGDEKEAVRCLQELEVPHFHHQVVFQASVMVIEAMHERSNKQMAGLLAHFYAAGLLTDNAVCTGFLRLYETMPDLALDVPPAYTLLERWVNACMREGLLKADVVLKMPQKGRKRFVSEGDGGRLKVVDMNGPVSGDPFHVV